MKQQDLNKQELNKLRARVTRLEEANAGLQRQVDGFQVDAEILSGKAVDAYHDLKAKYLDLLQENRQIAERLRDESAVEMLLTRKMTGDILKISAGQISAANEVEDIPASANIAQITAFADETGVHVINRYSARHLGDIDAAKQLIASQAFRAEQYVLDTDMTGDDIRYYMSDSDFKDMANHLLPFYTSEDRKAYEAEYNQLRDEYWDNLPLSKRARGDREIYRRTLYRKIKNTLLRVSRRIQEAYYPLVNTEQSFVPALPAEIPDNDIRDV